MTTEAKKKLAWGIGIFLVVAGIFAFVYFKYIKPRQDKKREEERLKKTAIVQGAQPDLAANITEPADKKEQTPDLPADIESGIGGRKIAA